MTHEEDFSEEYESWNQWWSRVSAETWDGSQWWGPGEFDDAAGWTFDDAAGWMFIRSDGLVWQYVSGNSTYSHGNGYGFGQWHLCDPSLPPDPADAASTAAAAATVEIEISPEPSDDETEIA